MMEMNQNYFLLPFIIFSVFAIPVSIIDIKTRRIPDILSISCFLLVFAARLYHSPETMPFFLAAALSAFALFFCIALGTGGLGFGDVKFAAVIGLVCGFPGVLAALFVASVLGLFAALSPLFRGPDGPVPIPFAPFLCAGTLLEQLLLSFF
jgi:prepilin signal peptidase PulO-like enzyme (type II secretory pathway)